MASNVCLHLSLLKNTSHLLWASPTGPRSPLLLATTSLCTHPGLALAHLLPTQAYPIMLLHTPAGTQEVFLYLGSCKPHCWKQSWWAFWRRRRIFLELTAMCSWSLEGSPSQ